MIVAQLVERSLQVDTTDPRFDLRQWQIFINQFIYQLYDRKDENKEKEAGKGPAFFLLITALNLLASVRNDELKTLPVRSFTPQGVVTEKVMLLRLFWLEL